jgi:hypothetical protein
MGDIIDYTAPSIQGGYPRTPESLPHGQVTPSQAVRELLAKEKKAKHRPDSFAAAAEERILHHGTIDYYFDSLGQDVIYRQTPDGPEVLAVGYEELIRLKKTLPLEEQLKLKSWTAW